MKNTLSSLLFIVAIFLFFVSCSEKTSNKESQNVQNKISNNSMDEQITSNNITADFLKTVTVISNPFDVTYEHLENLNNYPEINKESFDKLNLGKLEKLDKVLKHLILGKVEFNEYTGILISQITDNEAFTWFILYNSSYEISDFVNVFYDNSEGMYSKYCRIQNDQVLITTQTMDNSEDIVYSIDDNGKFIEAENSTYNEAFNIPPEEVLHEGIGRLTLVYNTTFKGISEDGIYLLFSEELNTDMIGGPPAINYQLVSSRSGKIIRTIPVSYNPELGEGKKLMNDMDLGQIDEINKSQAQKAEKELESYKFKKIREKSNAYIAMVDIQENDDKSDLVFSLMRNDGEEMIQLEKQSFIPGRIAEITELIIPANEQFVIISYIVPGSMEYPESSTGSVVVGRYKLSELYKKTGFNYYDIMVKKGGYDKNKESVDKSLKNLNKALSLNGANEYAAYYLACLYTQMNNTESCIATLEHLGKIKSTDAESLLEMVKSEPDFDNLREIPAFDKFIETIN